MKRIIVIGSSCSGKSTFAKVLSEKLSCKYIELDELHWLPNWQERSDDEFRLLVRAAIKEKSWVMDGNYSVAKDNTWPKATTIIWLNYSFPVVLYRAIRRSIVRAATKQILFAGNVETFKQSFLSKESIIWWVLTTYHEKRARYLKQLNSDLASTAEIMEFKTPAEATVWLNEIEKIHEK